MRLLGPLISLCAFGAWADAPRVPLAKGFTPNPTLMAVQRSESQPLAGFAPCKDAAANAMVSKAPVLVLELAEGITHLDLTASQGDRVVAKAADGTMSCGEKSLKLDVKPGALEIFLVSAGAVSGPGKVRVFDANRPRILPDVVKTVAVPAKGPVLLEGESGGIGELPDAQLDVAADLKGLQWKLTGSAQEVWLSALGLENQPPVKAGDTLAAGRYAVWIRGTAKGTYKIVATAGAAPADSGDPLLFSAKPAADAPVEGRALVTFMPKLDVESLKGWSRGAQTLRKRAFTELPGEFFVFAAADGEVLLPLQVESGGEVSVISADGATFSMPTKELALKPSNGAPLVRPARSELLEKLTLADLVAESDPRVKKLEKLRKKLQSCVDKHPEWPDADKRCNLDKADKAEAKLVADLKKAHAKQRAAELMAVERHVKSVIVSRAD